LQSTSMQRGGCFNKDGFNKPSNQFSVLSSHLGVLTTDG